MHQCDAGDAFVIAALLTLTMLSGGDVASRRAAWAGAASEPAKIQAGLSLLDALLREEWKNELTIDLAMLGLADAERHASASALIDEALVVSMDVDAALRSQAEQGVRVSLDAARWARARGLACAASALLTEAGKQDAEAAKAEALVHLVPLLERDRDGRARRLVSHLYLRSGNTEQSSLLLKAIRESSSTVPLEDAAATAVSLRLRGGGEWKSTLQATSEPWRVVLYAEAAMAALQHAGRPIEALTVSSAANVSLQQCGMDPHDAFVIASAMATRLNVQRISGEDMADLELVAVVGAAEAAIAYGQPMQAADWLRSALKGAAPSLQTSEASAVLAQAEAASGKKLAAMRAWIIAAEQRGPQAASRLDQAASIAASLARGPHRDEAWAVLELAAISGERAAAWTRTLAAIEVNMGAVDVAVKRLQQTPPGGDDQIEAMREIGLVLRDRAQRSGSWQTGDEDSLQIAYATALAAAAQQHDHLRAAKAEPIAAALGATIVYYTLEQDGAAAAKAISGNLKALTWLTGEDRLQLDAVLAASAGDADGLRAVLARASDADTISRRVLRQAGSQSVGAAACMVGAFETLPPPGGQPDAILAIADVLRQAARCDDAVKWYDAVLASDPSLFAAVLGRCDCLRHSDDRAMLAEAARGYRRIAAMPRVDNPDRWRAANTRLLEVLRRAGADQARLDAMMARLRAIDPDISDH
jgi:tetratricopeptide (TPR) repeat protein